MGKKVGFTSTGVKVKLSGAQGTRILGTTDRTDHKVREQKVIQLSGPQPGASNDPHFSGWAPKPYLYIESSVLSQQQTSVLSQQKTSILSQRTTSILFQQQTSDPGLRRPRQRPTKSMTANPWLAEAAIAADQKVYMVPWMTQV